MNIVDRILKLEQQERKIEEEIETLCNSLDHNEWNFYVNTTQYDNPRINAWKPGGSILAPASFTVKGNTVQVIDTSMYPDTWKEAEAIINKWLNQDFSNTLNFSDTDGN